MVDATEGSKPVTNIAFGRDISPLDKIFTHAFLKPSEIRLPELDGLRGLAILFVLLWHCIGAPLHPASVIYGSGNGLLSIVKQQFIILRSGVDLFFVLSGFLIGGILLDNRKAPRYFQVYYGRRILRIFPIYYVMLIIFIVAKTFGANGILFDGSIPLASYFTFTQNYLMCHLNTSGAIWLAVTWSLAVEEQFYAGFPLIVRCSARRFLPIIFAAGIMLAPILRIWTWYHFGTNYPAYVWLPCRIDSLFLGALLTYGLRQPAVRAWMQNKRRMLAAAFIPLLGGFIALDVCVTRDVDYHMTIWGQTFLAYFYGWGILLTIIYAGSRATQFLRSRWLTFLGLISYGVYLMHVPVLFIIFRFFSLSVDVNSMREEGLVLLSLVITLVLCTASYFLFEKPLIQFGRRWKY